MRVTVARTYAISGLEGTLEADEERVVDLHHDVAFNARALELILGHDVLLLQHLHGIDAPRRLVPHLKHLAERTLPNDAKQYEIVWLSSAGRWCRRYPRLDATFARCHDAGFA